MLLTPSRRPSPSTSGPPDEPRGRGAVCSMAPWMRRPRGPRNERLADETVPKVTRSPRPPGLARANTGVPMPARLRVAPVDGRRVAGVDLDHGEVAVGVGPGDAAALAAAVGEADGGLVPAQVVGVGEDAALGDDDAGAHAPAASDADDRRARPGRRCRRWSRKALQELQTCVRLPSHLQLASNPTIRGQVFLCKIRDPVRQRKT